MTIGIGQKTDFDKNSIFSFFVCFFFEFLDKFVFYEDDFSSQRSPLWRHGRAIHILFQII